MFCSIWTLYCILHLKQNLPSIFTFDVILLWEVNSCLIHVHMAVLVIINICLWCKLVIKDVLMSMILLFIIAVICWIYVWNCCKTLKQVMFPSCSVLYLNYICEYNFFHKNCFCSFTCFFQLVHFVLPPWTVTFWCGMLLQWMVYLLKSSVWGRKNNCFLCKLLKYSNSLF